jgi:hypothetical protein
MKHVPAYCMVNGCKDEASYWIDTEDGFVESLLTNGAPSTFYLCADHMTQIVKDETGGYQYLRIDTGEIVSKEIGGYSCSDKCRVCNQ